LVRVLWRGRPHELILNGQHRRLWLYFAGNCRYEPVGTAPAYRPDLADGYLDIRLIVAGPLARWRIVAAVITGTLARCRVYQAWRGQCGGADGGREVTQRAQAGGDGTVGGDNHGGRRAGQSKPFLLPPPDPPAAYLCQRSVIHRDRAARPAHDSVHVRVVKEC